MQMQHSNQIVQAIIAGPIYELNPFQMLMSNNSRLIAGLMSLYAVYSLERIILKLKECLKDASFFQFIYWLQTNLAFHQRCFRHHGQ